MRVHLLGGLRVEGFDDHELASRKGRQLLKALAVNEGKPVRPDALAEILWPSDPPKKPVDQIGVLVSRLRKVLGSDTIVRSDVGYALLAEWTDVAELRERAREAIAALTEGRIAAARSAALSALALGGDELLPGEDGEWVEQVRAEAAALMASARRVAIEAAGAAGDTSTVVAEAEAALAHDPYDETITRALMRAHVSAGRDASALGAYARLRERLVEDLGVSPTDETEQLHDQILLGDLPMPVPGTQTASSLVGRERELAQLDAALADASRGQSRLVLLEGEPGIGKTALATTWLGGLGWSDVAVFASRCDPLGRDLPLQAVADALASVHRSAGADTGSIHAADRRLLATSLGIGPVADEDDSREGSEADDGAHAPTVTRLYAAILRAMEALAGERTVVVSIDDLHLADRSTLEWIGLATRRSTRLLVVVTARSDHEPLPGATILRLEPLSLEAVALLVGSDRADDLHSRSGGNPLLLEALLDAAPSDLPGSIREAAEAQIATLGLAGDAIRTAAALGHEIDLDLVASVLRRPAIEVLADLERGVAAGLLVDDGAGLAFRHDLVRDAMLEAMTTARQALVHRDAARLLARRPDPDPSGVAHHARLGGDRELAAAAYCEAARAAELRHDLRAAEEYLDASIMLSDVASARVARARVRMSRQALEAAAEDATSAMEAGGGAEALAIAAWIAYYRRSYDQAQALADAAVATAAEGASSRIDGLAVGARVRHGRGDLIGALELSARVDSGPMPSRAVAEVWRAHALLHAGEPSAALSLAEHALAGGDQMAQPFAPLQGRFARTLALGYLGRAVEAAAGADSLVAAVEHFGEVGSRFTARALNLVGWTRRAVGRHDEARDANLEALEASGDADGPSSTGFAEAYWVAHLDLADGAIITGDLDRASELIDRMQPIEEWGGTMAWHQRHRLGVVRARFALARGDREVAAAHAAAVADDARRRGAGRYVAIAEATGLAADAGFADPDQVLDALDASAGFESWWITAAIAARLDSSEIRERAGRRAAALIRAAGDDSDMLRRWVDQVLN